MGGVDGAGPPPRLQDALAYAARGWPIFPCRRGGKEPLVRGGFKVATADPATLRAWWRRYDQPNLGMPTGRASGVVVLDVDPRNGGDESLLDLPALPETVECLTGGDGHHIYFAWPGFPVRCRSNAFGPGLDLKGDGGYVLLPPSVHPSGRRYEWEVSSHSDEVAIAPMPDWLLAAGRPAAVAPPHADAGGLPQAVRLPVGRRTRAFLARGAPIGEQRLRAVAAARNLLTAGYSLEAAAAAIWQGLQASPWDPAREPWTEADAYQIVADLAAKPAPLLQPLERKRISDAPRPLGRSGRGRPPVPRCV